MAASRFAGVCALRGPAGGDSGAGGDVILGLMLTLTPFMT